jgi:hypothetical protein
MEPAGPADDRPAKVTRVGRVSVLPQRLRDSDTLHAAGKRSRGPEEDSDHEASTEQFAQPAQKRQRTTSSASQASRKRLRDPEEDVRDEEEAGHMEPAKHDHKRQRTASTRKQPKQAREDDDTEGDDMSVEGLDEVLLGGNSSVNSSGDSESESGAMDDGLLDDGDEEENTQGGLGDMDVSETLAAVLNHLVDVGVCVF